MKKIIWLSICFFCLLSLPLQAEVVPLDTKPFEYELGEGQKSASDKDVKQMITMAGIVKCWESRKRTACRATTSCNVSTNSMTSRTIISIWR